MLNISTVAIGFLVFPKVSSSSTSGNSLNDVMLTPSSSFSITNKQKRTDPVKFY